MLSIHRPSPPQFCFWQRLILIAVIVIGVDQSSVAALRKTVASGNWSDVRIWESAIAPVDSDDVLITAGTEVVLDVASPKLANLSVEGTLHGSIQWLQISNAFTGTGNWQPERGTVIYIGSNYQALTPQSIGQYYDLILSDTAYPNGPRILSRTITVDHDLRAVFGSDTASVSGTGSAVVGGSVFYLGGSPANWTGVLRFVSAGSSDTSFFSIATHAGGSVQLPQVIVAKRDSALVRLGSSKFISDTLTVSNSGDTIVSVESGSFDLQDGWISLAEPITSSKPIVRVGARGQFRTAAPLPVLIGAVPDARFDSLHTPLFVLDSGSTFEYYSYSSDVADISYLRNNIVGQSYQNLVLGKSAIGSAWANSLTVFGSFHIEYGATFIPKNVKSGVAGNALQDITLYGDVMNDAPGPNGAPGFYGGILSTGTDRWTFASVKSGAGKDTVHWSGPSQLGTVVIQPNVVLSVRHESDTAYDSLDVVDQLIEQAPPCGGHLIGTVYSEVPVRFDAAHSVDSLHGIGLILTSGADPYPGNIRVTRTSGYLPPGADPASHPILRYYATYADTGAQRIQNGLRALIHCDEIPYQNGRSLSLWRSREKRGAWLYLGKPRYDSAGFAFEWSADELYPIGTRRPYYWMFAEGYRDTPTPVELLNFHVASERHAVLLDWQTASEIGLLGFEVERVSSQDTTLIDSWSTNDALKGQSVSGATYSLSDALAPSGLLEYRLYERSQDGIRTLVANRTLFHEPTTQDLTYWDGGLLHLSSEFEATEAISVYDVAGLRVGRLSVVGRAIVPIALRPGVYAIVSEPAGVRSLVVVR